MLLSLKPPQLKQVAPQEAPHLCSKYGERHLTLIIHYVNCLCNKVLT